MSIALGLRSKIILLASFFLILPWLGYQYILEMENFLRQGQEQILKGTTRAVATTLHERPKLFNAQVSSLNKIEDGKDLFAYHLQNTIQIDGKLDDWVSNVNRSMVYQHPSYQRDKKTNNPISFQHMLGTQAEYLYGYLKITDKHPTFRNKQSRFLNRNDHLIIAISHTNNSLQRYIISVEKPGWFNAYRLNEQAWSKNQVHKVNLSSDIFEKNKQREKRIQGFWRSTSNGYNIEFRLPINMLGDKFGFSLHSTSNQKTGEIDNIIATSNTSNLQQLGTIVVPSPEIDNILKGLSHTKSRLWILDRHQRVLASAGDIHQASGIWSNNEERQTDSLFWLHSITKPLLAPLYNLLLAAPNTDFIDELQASSKLNSEFIKRALLGQSQSDWRFSSDNKVMILSAASPIFIGDQVMGIVVAEETTNGIRSLRNQALQKLFNVLIAVIVIATLLLFLFTANIATRITKLRNQADNAIDKQGRISAPFPPSSSSDEIGDLSRSLADMVCRLGEYHRYLENLAARLAHELGTPIAVIGSSLDNLALLPQETESQKYISRSQTGITRLNRILRSMSEATRLEQSLQSGEKIPLSLNELLTGCVQGYQMTYQNDNFSLTCPDNTVEIAADPDFMVQCLDKLINNAMEFNAEWQPIEIKLSHQGDYAFISVENRGPLLPKNMSDELLNSMVSVRVHRSADKTHLGLGLFIAKMICDFHHGSISINNNENNSGVKVTLRFPMI